MIVDSFRANNTHMAKFPGDVSLAEIRTDGNPNILSDPIFAPQKQNRSTIIAEVFGSPSPKKTPKESKHVRRVASSKFSLKPVLLLISASRKLVEEAQGEHHPPEVSGLRRLRGPHPGAVPRQGHRALEQ